MHTWFRQRIAWVLFIGLVLLLVANAWLFLPRFILQQQKLTKADLVSQAETLANIASKASNVTSQLSTKSTAQTTQQLVDLQQKADDEVVKLQHAPYEVSLNKKVQQYLELAQIIAFTIHDATYKTDDPLQMSRTAQILRQAATSAANLPKQQ